MKKISFKGASWDSMFLTFAKVLTMAFGIILSKIMSTGLSLEKYGTYSQVNLVTSIATSFILLGLVDALNFFYNKKNDNDNMKQIIVNTIFFIEVFAGIVAAGMIIVGRAWIGRYFSNDAIERILFVASIIPLTGNIVYFYQVLYVSAGKAKQMSLYNLLLMILKIVSAFIAVYIIKDILWIYVILVLLDVFQILLFKKTLLKSGIKINIFNNSPKKISGILSYSLPMGIYAITSTLTRDIDKLIIGRMAGTEDLAIYTNCSKILPFDFLVVSFATVLIPYIVKYVTEGNKQQTIRLFSNYMKIGYYSVWILGMLVLTVPKTVLSFLYDEKYVVGLPIFIIYIFDSMLRFASMHLILTASSKTKVLMIYSLISLGLNVILNLGFYVLFGVVGPAIATLIVSIIYTGMIMNKTIRTIKCKWKDIFCLKEILVLVISLVTLWMVGKVGYKLLYNCGVHEYIAMIITISLTGCCALLLHFKQIMHTLKEINSFRM